MGSFHALGSVGLVKLPLMPYMNIDIYHIMFTSEPHPILQAGDSYAYLNTTQELIQ